MERERDERETQTITCPNCSTAFEPHRHSGARWIAAGAGAVVGGAVTESILGALMIGGLTYGVAAAVDEYQARRCPECHTVAFGWRKPAAEVTMPEEQQEPAPQPH